MPDISPSGGLAIACAALGIVIVCSYLVWRPSLDWSTRLWLGLGLGILPLGTAVAGTMAGMKASKERHFCSSCHVMHAHTGDALDPNSQSLAARHSRNPTFGHESCYVCHADYGMFGTVATKINGMVHVAHYLEEFKDIPLDEALPQIHLFEPYPNRNCQQCHTGTTKLFRAVPDHASAMKHIQEGSMSCVSSGCHGYAHPFSKEDADAGELWREEEAP